MLVFYFRKVPLSSEETENLGEHRLEKFSGKIQAFLGTWEQLAERKEDGSVWPYRNGSTT